MLLSLGGLPNEVSYVYTCINNIKFHIILAMFLIEI
jgi:hypothetical protein